jgi:hypothetical protein
VRAAELLRSCLAAGGSAEPCRRDAEDARRACIEARCEEPCLCTHLYNPVCGVDGTTYGNACEARCARIDIQHDGPCEPQCQPVVCRLLCEHGFERDEAGCEICQCARPQPPCYCLLLVFKPVCGTDGQTYTNACFVACVGVEVVHEGPCRP